MGTVNVLDPVELVSFSDNAIDAYIAADREVFIDARNGTRVLRIGDGVTPGGTKAINATIGGIMTPNIVSPIDGALNLNVSPSFTGDAFNGLTFDGLDGVHAFSTWQVSTTPSFSGIIWERTMSDVYLTSIDLDLLSIELPYGVQLYVRVKYTGDDGAESEWSDIVSFSTQELTAYNNYLSTLPNPGLNQINGISGYGQSVAFSGDGMLMVVGCTAINLNGTFVEGGAFVYAKNGVGIYQIVSVLSTPNELSLDIYGLRGGSSVAISDDGDIIAIGYEHEDIADKTNVGAVRTYKRSAVDTWDYVSTVHSEYKRAQENFGASIALSGDAKTLVVGIPNTTVSITDNAGAVEVFIGNGDGVYIHGDTLYSSGPESDAHFGSGVALSSDGKKLYIGEGGKNTGVGTGAGVVYVYVDSGGGYVNTGLIPAPPGASDSHFGSAIAATINGEFLVISAPGDTGPTSVVGKVYLYRNTSGTAYALVSSLSLQGVIASELPIGAGIARDGSVLAAGIPGDANHAGTVQLFG